MNFQIPTDQHQLTWLTDITISSHCDIASNGSFTRGFGVWYKSTVSHLLAETRHSRGYEYGGKILPLLGALSAMDQFGECYKPALSTFPKGYASKSGIIKSAHNFLGIPVDTLHSDALYAIRNSLMHQSSLISVGNKVKPKHFWFEIDNTIDDIFVHASTAWDGLYNTRTDSNRTIVNTSKILDLAFKLNSELLELHKCGSLRLVLPGGLKELLTTSVNLKFDNSFIESYLFYLGVNIIDSFDGQSERALKAQGALSGVTDKVLNEAAIYIAPDLGEAHLAQLILAYPAAAAAIN